ncbi:MAG: hypothetical protein CMH57_05760 [Myxococcales bacterium]|nr:hypothetical protein [Myxococcales bacterium]
MLLDSGRSRKRDVGLFMIVRGAVDLSLRGIGGRLDHLAELGQWDVFGESRLLTGRVAPMVASARTEVEVLALPEAFVLSELTEELPGFMEMLRDTYHSRLKDTLFIHHPLLRPLEPEIRGRLRVKALPAGGVAVTQGAPCDGLYVILRGRMIATASGQIVASLQAGDLFNGDALTMDAPASAVTVQATGEEVALLQIDREALGFISASQPSVVESLVEHLLALQPSYGRHGIIRTV